MLGKNTHGGSMVPKLVVVIFFIIQSVNVILTELTIHNSIKKNVVCHYQFAAGSRPIKGRLRIEDIDPYLCTHYILNYLNLSQKDELLIEKWKLDGVIKRFAELKNKNHQLKILLSIKDSTGLGGIAGDAAKRNRFIQSIINSTKTYNLDGIHLDWRHPNDPLGDYKDKRNYVRLLKGIKEACLRIERSLIVSASISASMEQLEYGYDIPNMSKYLDFLDLLTFDYHGYWDDRLGFHTPLYGSKMFDLDDVNESRLNINWTVNHLKQLGAPPEKMLLGCVTYGRTFRMADAAQDRINSPAGEGGRAGPYLMSSKMMGYNELCRVMQDERDWKVGRDSECMIPYGRKDKTWISFEDAESISLQADMLKNIFWEEFQ